MKRTTEKNYEEVEKHVTTEKLLLKTIFPWKMKTKEMNRCQTQFGSLCLKSLNLLTEGQVDFRRCTDQSHSKVDE